MKKISFITNFSPSAFYFSIIFVKLEESVWHSHLYSGGELMDSGSSGYPLCIQYL